MLDWDDLVFTDSPGVLDGKNAMVVPFSAGPQGLIYDAAEVEPGEVDSFADLFDPQFADRVALEADYPLPAIAETALALGIEEPMELTADELEQVKAAPDRQPRPVPLAVAIRRGCREPLPLG